MRRVVMMFAVCLLFLSGCGGQESHDRTNIVLLNGGGTTEGDNQVIREIYKDFEIENPDIKLDLISMPSPENAKAKLKKMISVGKMPNLVYIGEASIDTLYSFMVDQGYVVDIMPYIQEDKEFREMISQENMNRWKTEEGKLYTVTDVLNTGGYWYNKQIFKNAGIKNVPETWEEFLECCSRICQWRKEKYLNTIPVHMDAATAATILQSGVSCNDLKGVQETEMFRMLKLLKKNAAYTDIEKSYTHQDTLRSFNVGHCAIYIGEIVDAHEMNPNLQMGYAVLPGMDGKDVGFISSYPGYFIGSSCDEKQKEACIRFLKYMLSERVQSRIWKETGHIPSNPNVDIPKISDVNEVCYQSYKELMDADRIQELPDNCWGDKKIEIFKDNIFKYLSGEITEKEFYWLMK